MQASVAQDAQSVIAKASHAIGADAVKSLQYSATGFDFAFGQSANPSAPWPKFIEKSYTRTIDFETRHRVWTAFACRARIRPEVEQGSRWSASNRRAKRPSSRPVHPGHRSWKSIEATYSDYRDVNGARFPTHIVQTQGDYPVLDLQVSDVKINVPANIEADANGS